MRWPGDEGHLCVGDIPSRSTIRPKSCNRPNPSG